MSAEVFKLVDASAAHELRMTIITRAQWLTERGLSLNPLVHLCRELGIPDGEIDGLMGAGHIHVDDCLHCGKYAPERDHVCSPQPGN